jgi:hypothetical protein
MSTLSASTATEYWNSLWRYAQTTWAPVVQANPQEYQEKVTRYVQDLRAARASLDRMKAALGQPGVTLEHTARYNRLAREHYELASRFQADLGPGHAALFGFVPLLYVLGLAVGTAATAWAAATWQYATNLREQTALAARELDARVEASREGRALQPSTLPPPAPPPKPLAQSIGGWLLGALVIAGGIYLAPSLLKNNSTPQ